MESCLHASIHFPSDVCALFSAANIRALQGGAASTRVPMPKHTLDPLPGALSLSDTLPLPGGALDAASERLACAHTRFSLSIRFLIFGAVGQEI